MNLNNNLSENEEEEIIYNKGKRAQNNNSPKKLKRKEINEYSSSQDNIYINNSQKSKLNYSESDDLITVKKGKVSSIIITFYWKKITKRKNINIKIKN